MKLLELKDVTVSFPFAGGKTLTAQEAEELKHLIDEHKEG